MELNTPTLDTTAGTAVETLRRLVRFYAYSADTAFTTSDAMGEDGIAPSESLADLILHAAANVGAIGEIEPGLWEAYTTDPIDARFMGVVNKLILKHRRPQAPDAKPDNADDSRMSGSSAATEATAAIALSPRSHHAVLDKLIPAREAAKLLGVCDKTLWSITDRGEIPVVRIGRRVSYDPRDLSRWIESSKTKGGKSSTSA